MNGEHEDYWMPALFGGGHTPSVSNEDLAAAMGYDIGAPSSYFLPPSGANAQTSDIVNTILQSAQALGRGAISPRGLMGIAMMLFGRANKLPSSGGGEPIEVTPKKITRTVTQGPRPIAQYAANGGLMQAYAHGGAITGTHQRPMQMEDGGFVMTKRAVDGAGGPQGIAQLLPGARSIVGPGTGTSDHIPATINGNTPARVSNGEAYVPKRVVDEAGGAQALYALMNQLQRRA